MSRGADPVMTRREVEKADLRSSVAIVSAFSPQPCWLERSAYNRATCAPQSRFPAWQGQPRQVRTGPRIPTAVHRKLRQSGCRSGT